VGRAFFLKALKITVLGKLWFSKLQNFLETAVFLEYFKNLELPNGA
jgi:hypothetical protein